MNQGQAAPSSRRLMSSCCALTERTRAGWLKLTGESGLLGKLTKMAVVGALEDELDDHLGYVKNDPAGRDGGNYLPPGRCGHRCARPGPADGPCGPRAGDGAMR